MPLDFIPYSDGWAKEMMQFTKPQLINKLKEAYIKVEKFKSTNRPIMPVCPHAKVKWVVCDCGVKSELDYDFLDCNGDGTYSVPGNNGFGYSRQCGKVAPGKPA
jgi:hypothetical protein